MATGKSGYFDITGDRGFTVRIHWAETYDILTNKSTLSITSMQFQSITWSYTWFPGGTISVDGTVVKEMSYIGHATHMFNATANSNWHEVKRANAGYHGGDDPYPWSAGEFTHNADGTKSVTFSVDLKLYSTMDRPTPSVKGTYTIALTTIPRVSSLTVDNGTLGKAQTIKVTRQASSFTHTITYTCGSASSTICTKSSTTSISWTPPTSLAAQNTTGTSVKATMKIETFSGSTSIGTKTYEITLTIPTSVKPTLSIATSDPKGYFAKFGGYIQNQSTCNVALTAAGIQGSTIKSYSITCGTSSSTKSSATFTLPTVGDITITAKVTDSRGISTTATAKINVIEYANPKVTTLNAFRTELNGSMNAAKVTFTAAVTPLSNQNTAAYTIEYKPKDSSSWSQTVLDITDYEPKDVSTIIEDVDTSSSYDVRIAVTDYFGTIYSVVTTLSSQYALVHLDKSNNRIGLGKVAEGTNILDVGLDTLFRKGVTMEVPLGIESGGLGVTTLEEAQELLGGNIKVTKVTTAGTNLNDYKTPGWYFFPSSDYAPTNIPAGSNGWLQVITVPSSSWVKQIWYRAGTPGTNDDQTFVRTHSTSWGTWKKYYTTNITDLVAMNLAYVNNSELKIPSNADLNNYTTPGVYRIDSSDIMATITNRPPYTSAGARLIVSALSLSPSITQTIIFNSTYGYAFHRVKNNSGTWGNWISHLAEQTANPGCQYIVSSDGYVEWINPPMVTDTEYRTAERWNKKVVYTKLVKCGSMTSGGTVTYSTSTVYPIRFAGYCDDHALPVLLSDAYSSTWKMWVFVKNSVITTFFGSSWSKPNIYVQVWYVKS